MKVNMKTFKEFLNEKKIDGWDMKELIENLADNEGIDISDIDGKVVGTSVIYSTMNEKNSSKLYELQSAIISELSEYAKKYVDVYSVQGDGLKSWDLKLTYNKKWYDDYLERYA